MSDRNIYHRIIPQFVIIAYCTMRGHKQMRYSAWKDGVQIVAYTCPCGKRQSAKVLPANRKIRRAR